MIILYHLIVLINDMIITLIKPLSYFYKIKPNENKSKIFNNNNLKIEKPKDKRFKILKYKKINLN